ncbi:Nitric oxide synthase [Sergentomyia squamirostris]
MAQHLTSMLEHLKLGGRKNSRGESNGTGSGEYSSAGDTVDCVQCNTTNGNNNNNHVNNITTAILAPVATGKRPSISLSQAPLNQQPRNQQDSLRARDLSPTPRVSQRKLSADLRNREMDGESKPFRPVKLRNMESKVETVDTLHLKGMEKIQCRPDCCNGSIMFPNVVGTEPRKPEVILDHAKDFLEQYFTSIRRFKSPAHEARLQQVQNDIETTGTYHLTETELIFGAKLAWRNANRCIGRIQWSKLQVFDCRYVTTTSGMFEAICNHIKYSTNKGNIRSAITVFPQRTDGKHDYRVWNSQFISYAGYREPDGRIIGDPSQVEFTELCMKLGWKPPRTEWDILPMVLSANGHDPEYFEYPRELILEVPITHPTFKWFSDFGLRWYAVPAVSNMLFDCGGLQFTGAPFNGWYMSTEIGCRNLCDEKRRNMLEPVALKMGLDTRNPASLWKDKALVEINIAVLHSFQSRNVTIMDHHTLSESFIKHLENESRLRKGCPADWVWIVPPLSSSTCEVFHQEMANYYLKPSYDYQEPANKTHVWKKNRDQSKSKKPKRKFHFKQIARAVKFTSKLFGRALSKRIKATILYATETGKSEAYAKKLTELFAHAFNAEVYNMEDFDVSSIEHEALILVVASTFGNGDPPENGESFAHDLYAMKVRETGGGESSNGSNLPSSSKAFIKANSRIEDNAEVRKISRLDSIRGGSTSTAETLSAEAFGPLSNVHFAVFALGSSAYPNFCAFGKYVDNLLGELGGERIMKLATGDEISGQEQDFHKWAPEVFKVACDTFCLDPNESLTDTTWTVGKVTDVRFSEGKDELPLDKGLATYHHRKVVIGNMKKSATSLQHGVDENSERVTILVEITANGISYEPGDHVGIFPENRQELVNGIIERLAGVDDASIPIQLELLTENHTSNGVTQKWVPHHKIPACSLKTLLTRYLDITTTPSRQILSLLSTFCKDKEDEKRLNNLANDSAAYEDWRYYRMPNLLEILQEFPSCRPPAAFLVNQLTPLQPRFYSISSSLMKHKNEVHLTIAIVKYRTKDGQGPEHYGVCSNYLNELNANDTVYFFFRSAQSFHTPKDTTKPIILIGPGTGIAPFRSFWQQWEVQQKEGIQTPKAWLLFGCRDRSLNLYRDEKEELLQKKIFDRVFLALSREKDIPKTYVQDIALKEADSIYQLLVVEHGHVYVCGDVTMAEHVYQTLRKIIAGKESKGESEADRFMLQLRDENRYHEDIFGITLRTAEVHNKSRESARIRMASQP